MTPLLPCVGLVVLSILSSTHRVSAALSLPAIFGDHMVLQAEQPLKFWGKAAPGETITVVVRAEDGSELSSGSAVADGKRNWMAALPAVPAGQKVVVDIAGPKSGEKALTDVLTGEVWLLSGQSNMRWTLAKAKDGAKEVAAADHQAIRLFLTAQDSPLKPKEDLKGEWKLCTPESVADFSAAGFYFGRELQQQLGRPVGLILSAVGGTPIQPWIPKEEMDRNRATAHLWKEYEAYEALPPDKRPTARGDSIYGAKGQMVPGRLYNGMIHPLIPFAIRGVAWCQGENNSRPGKWGGPELYHTLFPMLVRAWRERWRQGDFPFIYLELANFMDPQKSPVDAEAQFNWAFIREAQSSVHDLPNISWASTIDIGEAQEIHYADKKTAGRRLAMAALGRVYAKGASPSQSPRYLSHEIESGKIRLHFADAQGGLITDDGQPPRGFAIRGASGDWRWAEAKIDGDDILVWHSDIPAPIAVRHAWASNPAVNVRNHAGLPLSSFRTDPEGDR